MPKSSITRNIEYFDTIFCKKFEIDWDASCKLNWFLKGKFQLNQKMKVKKATFKSLKHCEWASDSISFYLIFVNTCSVCTCSCHHQRFFHWRSKWSLCKFRAICWIMKHVKICVVGRGIFLFPLLMIFLISFILFLFYSNDIYVHYVNLIRKCG